MNEIYELKMKYHYYDRSMTDDRTMTELENSHTFNVLETKLVFLEKENLFLRSEFENKQKTIDLLFETNNGLFKSIRDPTSIVIQDSTSTDSMK